MIQGLTKPLRHCSASELHRHSEDRAVRASLRHRLYSTGLLEEAYRLAQKVGATEAAKISGVNKHTIRHYILAKKVSEGKAIRKAYPGVHRIPEDKKKACHKLAFSLFKKRFSTSMRKCWIEAGKRTGVVGRSVEFQYIRGIWKP